MNVIYRFLAALCDDSEDRDEVKQIQHQIIHILVGNLSALKSDRRGWMQQDGSSELARQAPGVQSDLIQTHLDTESVCPEVLVEAILSQVLILTPQVPHCNYKYVHADTCFTRKN